MIEGSFIVGLVWARLIEACKARPSAPLARVPAGSYPKAAGSVAWRDCRARKALSRAI